jgi:hypothetical protein
MSEPVIRCHQVVADISDVSHRFVVDSDVTHVFVVDSETSLSTATPIRMGNCGKIVVTVLRNTPMIISPTKCFNILLVPPMSLLLPK